jgi:methyl-accepting chemotaxis protein
MKILNPTENIASITSLVANAKKFVIIVSPYNDLNGWDELKNAINKASKEIDVFYFVRQGEGRKGIEDLDVKVLEVPMLHAKMFFSESEAMISSGNLTNRPDINWVSRLSKDEYEDLFTFFNKYIKPEAKPLEK